MENDLISRQKLIYDLEAWRNRLDRRVSLFDDMVIHALPAVFDLVNEQDAIEAEPVRHGRWVEWWPGSCALIMTGEEMLWMCSECEAKYSDKENMNYCPNCGARMDAEEDDHG